MRAETTCTELPGDTLTPQVPEAAPGPATLRKTTAASPPATLMCPWMTVWSMPAPCRMTPPGTTRSSAKVPASTATTSPGWELARASAMVP